MATYQSQYLGQLRNEVEHLQSGTKIITDAPTDNMGKGEAFSPTDLVAVALGTCIVTTMAIFGLKEDITFENTSISGTKIMTSEGPRKIAKLVVNIEVSSIPVLDQDQKQKYERIAHTCPVARSLHPDLIQEVTFNWLN